MFLCVIIVLICLVFFLKIINPNTRELCRPHEEGEICAKSNYMMMGYLNQSKDRNFDKDGFIMTGDLGYFDEHGSIHYRGRFKEILK